MAIWHSRIPNQQKETTTVVFQVTSTPMKNKEKRGERVEAARLPDTIDKDYSAFHVPYPSHTRTWTSKEKKKKSGGGKKEGEGERPTHAREPCE